MGHFWMQIMPLSGSVLGANQHLRAAGVSYEDRQDLLGHKSDRITTHYSAPDIARLIEAAELVCVRRPNTILRIAAHTNLAQSSNSAKAVKEGRS